MKNIINITQHEIRVRVNAENKLPVPDEQDIIYEPSGVVARVSTQQTIVGYAEHGIPIVATVFGEPINLPDPVEGTIYIGSTPLAQKAAQMGRTDVLAPNTAPKQDIRYPEGHEQAGKTFAVFNFQQF